KIQRGPRKEAGPRHLGWILEIRTVSPVGANLRKLGHLTPELHRPRYRPGVQFGIVCNRESLARIHAIDEARQVGFGHTSRRGAPDFGHARSLTCPSRVTGSSVPTRPRASSR